jgi:hypothetical protein
MTHLFSQKRKWKVLADQTWPFVRNWNSNRLDLKPPCTYDSCCIYCLVSCLAIHQTLPQLKRTQENQDHRITQMQMSPSTRAKKWRRAETSFPCCSVSLKCLVCRTLDGRSWCSRHSSGTSVAQTGIHNFSPFQTKSCICLTFCYFTLNEDQSVVERTRRDLAQPFAKLSNHTII